MTKPPSRTHNAPKLTLAGEWYRQRDEWMRELTERKDLSLPARLVGLHLALRTNRSSRKVIYMQTTIAKQTGMASETIRAALRALRKAKMIRVEEKSRGMHGRAVNHYALVYAHERDWIAEDDA